MSTTKKREFKTMAAECAYAIKQELKKEFPEIKFSVTSETYSMGDNVNISYYDGVELNKVEAITNKYQYGHFDGMTDMYENSNSRNDIPQAKYIFVSREFTYDFAKVRIDHYNKLWNDKIEIGKYSNYKGTAYCKNGNDRNEIHQDWNSTIFQRILSGDLKLTNFDYDKNKVIEEEEIVVSDVVKKIFEKEKKEDEVYKKYITDIEKRDKEAKKIYDELTTNRSIRNNKKYNAACQTAWHV